MCLWLRVYLLCAVGLSANSKLTILTFMHAQQPKIDPCLHSCVKEVKGGEDTLGSIVEESQTGYLYLTYK